jgi:hypothetical protein
MHPSAFRLASSPLTNTLALVPPTTTQFFMFKLPLPAKQRESQTLELLCSLIASDDLLKHVH